MNNRRRSSDSVEMTRPLLQEPPRPKNLTGSIEQYYLLADKDDDDDDDGGGGSGRG